jgi:hypothetical protein
MSFFTLPKGVNLKLTRVNLKLNPFLWSSKFKTPSSKFKTPSSKFKSPSSKLKGRVF